MLTIVFYASNGPAAKHHSREIAAEKGHYARTYDVAVWDRTADKCDAVEIMPDVLPWQRDRIKQVFGEKVVELSYEEEEVPQPEPIRQQMGLMPAKEYEPQIEEPTSNEKKAVHKGGGRWFVMVGDERISGPHDKAEALRLAEEGVS